MTCIHDKPNALRILFFSVTTFICLLEISPQRLNHLLPAGEGCAGGGVQLATIGAVAASSGYAMEWLARHSSTDRR